MRRISTGRIAGVSLIITIFCLLPFHSLSRPFVLVLTQDDLKDTVNNPFDDPNSEPDWDDFGDTDSSSEEELDPGSWRPVLEEEELEHRFGDSSSLYYMGVSKMVSAASSGEVTLMEEASSEIEVAAKVGDPHARSVLGFLYNMGIGREINKAKAFMYHYFATDF